MSEYTAPIRDMQFVVQELAGLDQVARLPGCEEATADVVEAIFDEAGKFANGVIVGSALVKQIGQLLEAKASQAELVKQVGVSVAALAKASHG